jgi:hypothetical protein
MVIIRYVLNLLQQKFTDTFHQEAAVNVFCKALYGFLFVKIFFSWQTSALALKYFPVKEPASVMGQILMAPAMLAVSNFAYFCWIFFAILLTALFIKRNYFTAILIAWGTWNLYKIDFLFSNGSDYILLMLVFLAIPMSSYPRSKNESLFFVQKVAHNTGLVLCQIQVALVYLLSGLDKIQSEMWQTGDAIHYVSKLTFLTNPHLAHLLGPGDLLPFLIAWFTILFELNFVILIWLKEFRGFVLLAGVVFHLAIAIFLSLPDFGLIMLIAYLPFLTTKIMGGHHDDEEDAATA